MHATDVAKMAISIDPDQSIHLQLSDQVYTYCHAICIPISFLISLMHTCQVLGKSKSEIARAPLIFAYNLVIKRAGKSGAQVLRVRFLSLFK